MCSVHVLAPISLRITSLVCSRKGVITLLTLVYCVIKHRRVNSERLRIGAGWKSSAAGRKLHGDESVASQVACTTGRSMHVAAIFTYERSVLGANEAESAPKCHHFDVDNILRPVFIAIFLQIFASENSRSMISGNRDLFDIIARDAPVPPWCRLTWNHSELQDADAVVFSALKNDLVGELPSTRLPDQLWTM